MLRRDFHMQSRNLVWNMASLWLGDVIHWEWKPRRKGQNKAFCLLNSIPSSLVESGLSVRFSSGSQGWGETVLAWGGTRDAIMTCHRLGGLNNRNIFSHSSGSYKSKIKVSAGLVSSETAPLSLAGRWLSSPCAFTWCFLCRCLCSNLLFL